VKRISMVAAAALLVAGTQLHAQAATHDTTAKKTAKHTAVKQASAAKSDKAAAKSADTSHKVAKTSSGTAKKEAAMKGATKHDSAAVKKKP
jgi:hypothetical protein